MLLLSEGVKFALNCGCLSWAAYNLQTWQGAAVSVHRDASLWKMGGKHGQQQGK